MGGFLDYVLIDFYSTCNFRALQRWVTLTPSGNAVKLRVNDINFAGYGEFRKTPYRIDRTPMLSWECQA